MVVISSCVAVVQCSRHVNVSYSAVTHSRWFKQCMSHMTGLYKCCPWLRRSFNNELIFHHMSQRKNPVVVYPRFSTQWHFEGCHLCPLLFRQCFFKLTEALSLPVRYVLPSISLPLHLIQCFCCHDPSLTLWSIESKECDALCDLCILICVRDVLKHLNLLINRQESFASFLGNVGKMARHRNQKPLSSSINRKASFQNENEMSTDDN